MNKKYCFGVLISFLLCTFLIGCGNVNSGESIEEYSEKNIKTIEKTANEYGALQETTTPSGMSVSAEEGTLKKDVIITLTEEDFTGKTNQLLKNSAKQYAIYGRIKVDDAFQQEYAVSYADKPLNVKLPNSLSKDVIEYYVGVRDNDRDSWRYSRINENENSESNPQTIYSLRASTDKLFFYFETTKLNYQFALFGLLDNEESKNIAIVTAAIPSVLPAVRKLDKDESKSISVSNGKYDEDIKVEVELQGRNLDKLNPSDYIIELTYMTDKGSIIKDLAGTNAVYDIPSKNAGAGNKYLHTVIIKDFTFDSNGKLVFTLRTQGVALADLPLKFSLGVKNAKDNVPALPFGYTKDISVEKFDGVIPLPPAKIVAASTRIKAGDPVTISWEKPEDDKAIDVKYDIYLSNGSDTTLVSENLTETTWTYPEDLEPLKIGSYTVTIVAKSAAGVSEPSEPIEFFVVDSQLTIPAFTEMPQEFIIGLNYTLSWAPIEDPLQNPITYNVWFCKDELTEEPTYKEISSNSIEIDTTNLTEGNYKLKLTATNGDTTVESDISNIKVTNPALDTLAFEVIQPTYSASETARIVWTALEDKSGNGITYNVWICQNELTASPTYSLATNSIEFNTEEMATGTYLCKVAATNGYSTTETEIKNFEIVPALIAKIADNNSKILDGFYSRRPGFFVTVDAGNKFNHDALKNAINITGADSEDVSIDWIETEKLGISFNTDLSFDTTYTISMNSIKDDFDYDIVPFEPIEFKVFPFTGSGTEELPYSASFLVTEIPTIPETSLVSLIATPSTNIETLTPYFEGYEISTNATVRYKTDTENSWNDLPLYSQGASYSADLIENLWPADKSIEASIAFSMSKNGNTVYFETNPKEFTTEDGSVITLGTGCATDPYLIYTPGQLDDVRNHLFDLMSLLIPLMEEYTMEPPPASAFDPLKNANQNFSQIRNIDLQNYIQVKYPLEGWHPIGDNIFNVMEASEMPEHIDLFLGNYNGNNKIIDNLLINIDASSAVKSAGLFSGICGNLFNMNLRNANVICNSSGNLSDASVLTGLALNINMILIEMTGSFDFDLTNTVKVENCNLYNTNLQVNNCPYLSNISLLTPVAYFTDFTDCEINGNVTMNNSRCQIVSLAIDELGSGSAKRVKANGNINIEQCELARISGLVGAWNSLEFASNDISIEDCVTTGRIETKDTKYFDSLTGLIGQIPGPTSDMEDFPNMYVKNCKSSMDLTIDGYNGNGEYGLAAGGIIGNCCITAGEYFDETRIKLSDCEYSGNITINDMNEYILEIGGLVGTGNLISIDNCEFKGKINYENSSTFQVSIGGLVGRLGSYIYDSYTNVRNCSTSAGADITLTNITEPTDYGDNYELNIGTLIGINYSDCCRGTDSLTGCSANNELKLISYDDSPYNHFGGEQGYIYPLDA